MLDITRKRVGHGGGGREIRGEMGKVSTYLDDL